MKKPNLVENPEILQALKKEVKKYGEVECTIGSISVVLRKVILIGGKGILSNSASPHSFESKYLHLCGEVHLKRKEM